MEPPEIEKSSPFITVEIIEYVPNSVVIKTILKKSTGNVSVVSVDSGEELNERTDPYDTFVQVIDGKIEQVIGGKLTVVKTGESIVIPANVPHHIKPDGRFKMILTVIKSAID